MINPTQRPLPYNTQHLQETHIHTPGGVRNHNPSKRAAANQALERAANEIGTIARIKGLYSRKPSHSKNYKMINIEKSKKKANLCVVIQNLQTADRVRGLLYPLSDMTKNLEDAVRHFAYHSKHCFPISAT